MQATDTQSMQCELWSELPQLRVSLSRHKVALGDTGVTVVQDWTKQCSKLVHAQNARYISPGVLRARVAM